MNAQALAAYLQILGGKRLAVLGDFCLDVYWHADMTQSELSRETPHFPLPIVRERMSPGGAGNVAANLAALSPGRLTALGVLGRDWRGEALRKELTARGVDVSGLVASDSRCTNAYIKPLRMGLSDVVYEDPRLDFENHAPLEAADEEALIARLDERAPGLDMLCVCDQMRFGCVSAAVRERINRLAKEGLPVLVDSRDRVGLYEYAIVKPNEVEAARALKQEGLSYAQIALALSEKNRAPALVTVGKDGCYVAQEGRARHVPGRAVAPPIDICGAGDTFMAAFAALRACGASCAEAAAVANGASSITIRKIGTTGTASREELLALDWE